MPIAPPDKFLKILAAACLMGAGSLIAQCPDTGETKVIKPNEGTGYYFYRLIGSKSFVYFLDGNEFSKLDSENSHRDYFRVGKMAFEVVLAHRNDFKAFLKGQGQEALLSAQAKYEQAYFREIDSKIHITDLGTKWRNDKSGEPERAFMLWKKQKTPTDTKGLQYLLSTPLDNDVVVVLSMLVPDPITEDQVFDQVSKYTSHFDLMSPKQCLQLQKILGAP